MVVVLRTIYFVGSLSAVALLSAMPHAGMAQVADLGAGELGAERAAKTGGDQANDNQANENQGNDQATSNQGNDQALDDQASNIQAQNNQPNQPSDEDGVEDEDEIPFSDDDILVIAERIRGQVDTDALPILELNEDDIASYGADSLTDLLAQLAPQVSSGSGRGSGRPVILVNGRRISGFREIRRYPPEAIKKVEILPEEVALKYGYPATQRVVNFVLKDNFTSKELELEYGGPTRGGRSQSEIELSFLRFNKSEKIQGGIQFEQASMLTEDERDIIQTDSSIPDVASDPQPAQYRSLASRSRDLELEASYGTKLGDQPDAPDFSLTGDMEKNWSRSLSGLDTVILTAPDNSTAVRTLDANALSNDTETTTYNLSSTLNQPVEDWQLDLTFNGSYAKSIAEIDRQRDTSDLVAQASAGTLDILGPLPSIADAGRDTAITKSSAITSLGTLRGTPVTLPAGDATLTVKSGYSWTRIESSDTRDDDTGETSLSRGDMSAGFNLGLPIASAKEGVLEPLGKWSINMGAGLNALSDFGNLFDWNAGATWNPSESLSLTASYSYNEAAPSLSQLGSPVVQTFNVPTYDFTNGETVLATVTTGGNPNLPAEQQRDWKLGAYYDLGLLESSRLSFEYIRNNSRNVSSSLPLLTPAIEAAFPDRVTRDVTGQLTAVDYRPITYAEQKSSRIRYGFNLFGRIGAEQTARGGGSGGFGRGAGAGAGGNRGGGGGRGGFDPARMEELRKNFCSSDPDGEFDLSQLPPFIRARLTNEDGSVNRELLKQIRSRFCGDQKGAQGGAQSGAQDGAKAASGAGDAGAGGPDAGASDGRPAMFDPEGFAALRKALCADPNQGEPFDMSKLPPFIRERLTNEDGSINQQRLARFKSRICSEQGAQGTQAATGDGASGQGSGPQGSAGQQTAANAGGRSGGQSGRRSGARGRSMGSMLGGRRPGRWFLSIYHSIELDNEALIAPGVPTLDLLDGDTLGSSANPRHTAELQAGVFHRGLGARLSGNYIGPGRVTGSELPGSSTLYYHDIATFNLRMFANLEQQEWLVGDDPGFFKGARMSLRINNLFDAHRRITDETGAVPIGFQPDLVNPIGRLVEIEFRKVF